MIREKPNKNLIGSSSLEEEEFSEESSSPSYNYKDLIGRSAQVMNKSSSNLKSSLEVKDVSDKNPYNYKDLIESSSEVKIVPDKSSSRPYNYKDLLGSSSEVKSVPDESSSRPYNYHDCIESSPGDKSVLDESSSRPYNHKDILESSPGDKSVLDESSSRPIQDPLRGFSELSGRRYSQCLTFKSSSEPNQDLNRVLPKFLARGTARSSSQPLMQLPHQFVIHNFKLPTFCAQCNNLLVGIQRQGLTCRSCSINVHERCRHLLVENNTHPCCRGPLARKSLSLGKFLM